MGCEHLPTMSLGSLCMVSVACLPVGLCHVFDTPCHYDVSILFLYSFKCSFNFDPLLDFVCDCRRRMILITTTVPVPVLKSVFFEFFRREPGVSHLFACQPARG